MDKGLIRIAKADIRRQMIAKRRELTKEECKERSKRICEAFLATEEYRNAGSILLYKAYNNEVDTDAVFAAALADKKTVAYPLSSVTDGEPDLKFYVINDPGSFTEGYKGIPEPDTKTARLFDIKADVCITPGVAFDRKCHRIGYGGAFYDRFLRTDGPRKVIGFAYDIQITEDFEPEESDRPVDMVITESGIYSR